MNSKKVLIIGQPFFNLEKELTNSNIDYIKIDFNNYLAVDAKSFDAILFIGVNILLNPSNIDLIKHFILNSKKDALMLYWTHEPFWDYRVTDVEYIFGKKIHFYNVYNQKVFHSIFSCYFGVGGILWRNRINEIILPDEQTLYEKFSRTKERNKPVCAYASCFSDFRLDIPFSLMRVRNNVIKGFYDSGICDVYGKGWGGEWKVNIVEESRNGFDGCSWGEIKVRNIQKNYVFSICIENSLVKNYVTEKFAQAIEGFTIPIYIFGNGLEEYFNVSDAIQIYQDGSNIKEAINIAMNMRFEEYLRRLESLTNKYNSIISQVEYINLERNKPALNVVNFLQNQ